MGQYVAGVENTMQNLLEYGLSELIFALLLKMALFAPVQPRSAGPKKDGLAYSIMVVRQILVLFVLVRIQVGQLEGLQFLKPATSAGFLFL